MRIGIDLMGGDSPPECFYPAILKSLKLLGSETTLTCLGNKSVLDEISTVIAKTSSLCNLASIEYQVASDFIAMDEDPLFAIRKKPGSSLVVGIKLLKNKKLDALISCGNTGALMACSSLFLPKLEKISRPALLVQLPTKKRPVVVLDVGGIVSCKAENLVSFAQFGAAYVQAIYGIEKPVIGLLNIGLESKKGNREIRRAFDLLNQSSKDVSSIKMHFAGNVEGREVFEGIVDVLVTDGFSGNVLLKTAEGVAAFIFNELDKTISQEINVQGLSRLESFYSSFEVLKRQFDYREYDGAIVCGVDGVIIKAHGNATEKAILSSILKAEELVSKNILSKLKH